MTKSIPSAPIRKRFKPTLTIKGFVIYCTNKLDAVEQRFDWENALIDAAIISSVTFFSTLGGSAVAGLNDIPALKAAAVAALTQFFIFLALKRGIVKHREAYV